MPLGSAKPCSQVAVASTPLGGLAPSFLLERYRGRGIRAFVSYCQRGMTCYMLRRAVAESRMDQFAWLITS